MKYVLFFFTTAIAWADPLRVSPHNPRYLADDTGKIVYVTGSNEQHNRQDYDFLGTDPPPAFDWDAYLDFLEERGHNFIRSWALEQTWHGTGGATSWKNPMPFNRPGPGNALDGKLKFDCTSYNTAYFDRLRQRCIDAGERGIVVGVMLFNGWSIDNDGGKGSGQPWDGHPYNPLNNINSLDGDSDNNSEGEESHSLDIPAITANQEAYVEHTIDTLNDLDNIVWEIANETGPDSLTGTWQEHMINHIRAYERTKPKQHLIGRTKDFSTSNINEVMFASAADWISPGDTTAERYDINPPAATGVKILITDTDHIFGNGGDATWVWKNFARGGNPIYLDFGLTAGFPENINATEDSIRNAMGFTKEVADRSTLAKMTPQNALSSTTYCLANPGNEYIVYDPNGASFTVNLSAAPAYRKFLAEWINPRTGAKTTATPVSGGSSAQAFTSPFNEYGSALHLRLAGGLRAPAL